MEGPVRVESAQELPGGPDRLLTGPQVAKLLGIDPSSWRTAQWRKVAPPPDDPGHGGDEGMPANRRTPRWKVSTIAEYRKERRRRGRPPKEWGPRRDG